MNVSIRHLKAFLLLAAHRSFTRAARASHLSQPAFSALIGALEGAVGLRLFDRNTRSVALTVEGRAFEDSARRVVRDFDAALAGVRDHAARRRGRVAVALLPSLAAGWLPQVLAIFRERYPGIELEVADVLSDVCIARVASGQADFALAAADADSPLLQTSEFCTDDYYLVCPQAHPLADLTPLRLADIARYPFVHLARTSSVRQVLDAAAGPMRFRQLIEVEQLATVMGMVRAGLGVSMVPGLTLFHFDQPGLVIRKLKVRGLRRTLYLIRPRDRIAKPRAARNRYHSIEKISIDRTLDQQARAGYANVERSSHPADMREFNGGSLRSGWYLGSRYGLRGRAHRRTRSRKRWIRRAGSPCPKRGSASSCLARSRAARPRNVRRR